MSNLLRRSTSLLSKLDVIRAAVKALADGPLHQPLILFFHGVEERIMDERLQVLHATLDDFEPLMRHLKREFCLIDADGLAQRLDHGRAALRRCVALTFDDGYQNNATIVAPLLRSLDIPFTIYLTTGGIGTSNHIPTFVARAALFLTERSSCTLPGMTGEFSLRDETQRGHAVATVSRALKSLPIAKTNNLTLALRHLLTDAQWSDIQARFRSDQFMNWDEVRQTQAAGACIASHGHEHVSMHSLQGHDEIQRQLNLSRDLITEHTGSCRHYAFPNGQPSDICPEALVAIEAAGFSTAVTTMPGALTASTSSFLLPRSCVYTVDEFQRRVLRSRLDGSARALRAWQADLVHQANCLA